MDLKSLLNEFSKDADLLIEILLKYQSLSKDNFISNDDINTIASYLSVSESHVCSVMAFYTMLSNVPRGKHIIQVCKDVPCYLNDDINVIERIKDVLGINVNQTTQDKQFTLEFTGCIGCCNESPAMSIDNIPYTNLTEKKIRDILIKFRGTK